MSEKWNTNGDDEAQIPLGTGEGGATEEYGAGGRFRVNTSTITLAAAFLVALGVLYLLGLQNKPRQVSATEQAHAQEVDDRIANMLKNSSQRESVSNLFASTSKLIEMLNGYFKTAVTSVELPGNPFEQDNAASAENTKGQAVEIANVPADDMAPWREASEVYAGLKVQMVMVGTSPAALVNDQMVKVGSHIRMWSVTDIDASGVKLSFKNKTMLLPANSTQLNKK